MAGRGSIQIQGLEKVVRALSRCDKEVVDAAMKGLEAGAMNIIADAKDNLRANGSVVTGLLRESGNVYRKEDEVLAGFFDTKNGQNGYAEYVEYGRRSGKLPPVQMLKAWAYKKFQLRDWKEAESIAWATARNIAKHGTKPHPFFSPAILKNYTKILNAIRDSVRRRIK